MKHSDPLFGFKGHFSMGERFSFFNRIVLLENFVEKNIHSDISKCQKSHNLICFKWSYRLPHSVGDLNIVL